LDYHVKVFLEEVQKHVNLKILAVGGNHDYYLNEEYGASVLDHFHDTGIIHVLNREVVTYSGVSFAGCTNWYVLSKNSKMSDERLIDNALQFTCEESEKDSKFLQNLAQVDVLVTHVPIVPEALHPVHAYSRPNMNRFYFQTHDLLSPPKFAISGHTHYRMDKVIGPTRYLSSPVGYKSEIFSNFLGVVDV
jgi:predicted phosphodiesterase